ncbi:hypothetical protein APED_02780 [Acanthopleuribacter pedis]
MAVGFWEGEAVHGTVPGGTHPVFSVLPVSAGDLSAKDHPGLMGSTSVEGIMSRFFEEKIALP